MSIIGRINGDTGSLDCTSRNVRNWFGMLFDSLFQQAALMGNTVPQGPSCGIFYWLRFCLPTNNTRARP